MAARARRRFVAIAVLSAAVLGLGACAVGGPATGPGPNAERWQGPSVPAADGSRLPVTVWAAAEPRAVILALHGYGGYGPLSFDRAARDWAAAGITTVAYDQRGFGRGPTRGQWPGADDLVADAVAVSRSLDVAGCPLAVVGQSMGGGVALAAAGTDLRADTLILSAPAIWGGDALNPLHRIAAWLAAAVVPDRRFTGEGVVRIQASDNIEAIRRLGRDPLYLGTPSAREILGLVRITDRAAEAATDVTLPRTLLLGEKDQIVPNRVVERVFDQGDGPREIIVYPEGWHLLFDDLQADAVRRDVANRVLSLSHGPCDTAPAATDDTMADPAPAGTIMAAPRAGPSRSTG